MGCRERLSREECNKGKSKLLQEVLAGNDSEGVVLVVDQHEAPCKNIDEGHDDSFSKATCPH